MREKLIGLLLTEPWTIQARGNSKRLAVAGMVADHLIANGVVVREKGEWIYDYWCEFKCSKCGALSKTEPRGGENFCPDCGCDMRGDKA